MWTCSNHVEVGARVRRETSTHLVEHTMVVSSRLYRRNGVEAASAGRRGRHTKSGHRFKQSGVPAACREFTNRSLAVKVFLQERFSECVGRQIVDVPVLQIVREIVK